MHTRQGVAEPAPHQHNSPTTETLNEPLVDRVSAFLARNWDDHTRQGVAGPAEPQSVRQERNQERNQELLEQLRVLLALHWRPLEKICPPGLCEQFLYAGTIDGISLYQHRDTLRYLYIDVLGQTYDLNFETARYERISEADARRLLARP